MEDDSEFKKFERVVADNEESVRKLKNLLAEFELKLARSAVKFHGGDTPFMTQPAEPPPPPRLSP